MTLAALVSQPAHSAGADDLDALAELDAVTSPPGSEGLRLEASGFISEELRSYPSSRGSAQRDEQIIREVQVEIKARLVDRLTLLVRPWLLVDELDTDLLRYEPLEAYLHFEGGHWTLTTGSFIESWGIADAFNPLDVLNRRDYGPDLLAPVARGELGMRVQYHFDGGTVIGQPRLSFYACPGFRQTDLPTDRSRFALSQLGLPYVRDTPWQPSGSQRIFTAVRLDHTLTSSALNADFQYVVAFGPDRLPVIGPLLTPAGVVLTASPYGTGMAGGGFRAVPNGDWASQFTLKAEAAYKRPYRLNGVPIETPDDYVQYAFGLDRLLAPLLADRDQLTIMLEFLGEVGANDTAARLRLFDSDLALRIFWEAGDPALTSVELRFVGDVLDGDTITEIRLSRRLSFLHDDLKLELGARYLQAPESSPGLLGRFESNGALSARLQFNF